MWEFGSLNRIQLDISTVCNAHCGSCSRYNGAGSREIVPGLVPGYMTIQKFCNIFSDDIIQKITQWMFCGNHSDAITNPDLLLILEKIISVNPDSRIILNTNAGLRDTDFWLQLGNLFLGNDEREVVFSVDGLEDTNHLYRRNVRWNKVINAMSTYCSTGAHARWDYLVFQHNEHQILEAKALAKKLGVRVMAFKRPIGLENGYMDMLDKFGNVEYTLYPSKENICYFVTL